jgi:sporulation protein YlmC with PRC-barrel domain
LAGFKDKETAMKNMHALALCAMLTPTFVLATGSAIAQEPQTTEEREQALRQNPQNPEDPRYHDTDRDSSEDTTMKREQALRQHAQNPNAPVFRDTDRDSSQATLSSVDHSKPRTAVAKRTGHDTFLTTKPARGLHADQLIGSDVKGQADGDTLGTINDLIFDEDGQIVAVIVGVGGFLGIGERDVAIGWDALERTARTDDDDDGYDYRFVTTRDSLKNAPDYKKY